MSLNSKERPRNSNVLCISRNLYMSSTYNILKKGRVYTRRGPKDNPEKTRKQEKIRKMKRRNKKMALKKIRNDIKYKRGEKAKKKVVLWTGHMTTHTFTSGITRTALRLCTQRSTSACMRCAT